MYVYTTCNVLLHSKSGLINICMYIGFTYMCMFISSFLVDIWSVGCIFAEIVRGDILLPGRDCILNSVSVSVCVFMKEKERERVRNKEIER